MLRPQQVIDWFKKRSDLGRNELSQLLDGLLVGGQIVIGGSEQNVQKATALMAGRARMGRMVSIQNAKLDVEVPTTFDTAAVSTLLLIQKNETFHETIGTCQRMLAQAEADGKTLFEAIQILHVEADKIGRL